MQCVKNVSSDRERGGDRITKLQRENHMFSAGETVASSLRCSLCVSQNAKKPARWSATPLPMVYQKGSLEIHKATADSNYLQTKMLDVLMPFLPTHWNLAHTPQLPLLPAQATENSSVCNLWRYLSTPTDPYQPR